MPFCRSSWHYNRRFAVAARSPEDAHRAVLHDARTDLALATRKLSKNLAFHEPRVSDYRAGQRLQVCDAFGAGVKVLHQGKVLGFRILAEGEPPVAMRRASAHR